jgi:stress response protein YsnF
MAQTVIGLFEDYSDAQQATQRLQQAGIGDNQVDVSRSSARNASDSDNDGENAITRFFKSLFGDNDDSDRYSKVGNSGTCIVTVHAQSDEEARRAAEILDDCGAIDVDERAAQVEGSGRFLSDNARSVNKETSATIPKIEEELEVGKRTVETGGVRLRSRIIEKPVEESIRLREEHVHVDREQVNRPVTEMDRAAFRDRDIELTERSEVPVVNKEARVVEEVKISKDVTERNETVRDTVRNTEVDVDDFEESNRRR